MMKQNVKNLLWHTGVVLIMLLLSCIYFYPVLSGKVVMQGDIQKSEAMAAEQKRVAEVTGEVPNWNSSMFSGMPGYQTAVRQQHSVFTPIKNLFIMRPLGLERNIAVLFLYMIGFYVALLALGCNPWLSLLGAVGFGFGSYNIIIIEAGHITKAWAMSMIAPILASMVLTFRGAEQMKADKKPIWKQRGIVWGFVLFTLALGLQITFNHIQITFYTVIGALCLGLSYLIYSIRRKYFRQFAAATGVLLLGCALAFGANLRHLLVNQEYSQYTMRGGSELTINPDGTPKTNATNGLDIDYAFSWSYGIGETYTLLVPGAYGGGSGEKVSKQSESYKTFRQTRMPLYWGEQPFTSGPVYFGAIICFLFVLGLLVVPGADKWWVLAATLLAIVMSWGRHFQPFNEWLFRYLPLYSKFRTPSMSLVLANVTMVLLAVLALKPYTEPVRDKQQQKHLNTALYCSLSVTVGLILILLLLSGMFSFSGASDRQMATQYGNQWQRIADVFIADRKALFMHDSWRSVFFILPVALLLWLSVNLRGKHIRAWIVPAIALLTLLDLYTLDRRYLNADNFTEPKKLRLMPSAVDKEIDRIAAAYGDKDYRVLNLAVNTFNDSQPSAFHHQIGGYSAAKLRRYQDLIDFHLSGQLNIDVLNMLNTQYVVTTQGVQRNPGALGNVWFVSELKTVNSPDEEILLLRDFNPEKTAIVDVSQWKDQVEGITFAPSETDIIQMQHADLYNPDMLTYTSHTSADRLAVFSEIYYAPDWRAYIDGKPATYIRADYVLRAMLIPAGDHRIEFRNEAPRLHQLDNYTTALSVLLCLVLFVAILGLYWRSGNTTDNSTK